MSHYTFCAAPMRWSFASAAVGLATLIASTAASSSDSSHYPGWGHRTADGCAIWAQRPRYYSGAGWWSYMTFSCNRAVSGTACVQMYSKPLDQPEGPERCFSRSLRAYQWSNDVWAPRLFNSRKIYTRGKLHLTNGSWVDYVYSPVVDVITGTVGFVSPRPKGGPPPGKPPRPVLRLPPPTRGGAPPVGRGFAPPSGASLPLPKCTLFGSSGRDVLRGTRRVEFICGYGGADRIYAGRGDIVLGGPGDDTIFARNRSANIVDGGPGVDRATIDKRLDAVRAVERRS